jgi:hypothetical protein
MSPEILKQSTVFGMQVIGPKIAALIEEAEAEGELKSSTATQKGTAGSGSKL